MQLANRTNTRKKTAKITEKYYPTAGMDSAYHQMLLGKQSRRLTQLVIGSQQ